MKSLWVLGVVLLLSVVDLEATSASQFTCMNRNLDVTTDDFMRLYIDGIEITNLTNANIYTQPDIVQLPCTTRLIAIHGRNGGWNAGFLASTDDHYILTNSSWKCSNINHFGWEEIAFDDSAWVFGQEYGLNGDWNYEIVPGISLSAQWIWLRNWNGQLNSTYEEMDWEVYCRKRLDPNYCATINPCVFGSTCIDEPNGEYQCICAPGYAGQNCSEVINYCDSSPCVNGGSCEPIVNGYVCQCQPGYTGDNCEYLINNCASFPCLNGGTCLSGIGYYVCICPPEWTGIRCDILINACDSNPCLNGGTCDNVGGSSFTCTCPIYWTGVICESPNYNEAFACGTALAYSQYPASNGFTRLCYFWAPLADTEGRNTECRDTITGIPLYGDYAGLLAAGGNFGCLVSQNYPDDLPATSYLSCADNYQQYVFLGNNSESDRLMVCIRYPYEGVPGRK